MGSEESDQMLVLLQELSLLRRRMQRLTPIPLRSNQIRISFASKSGTSGQNHHWLSNLVAAETVIQNAMSPVK
jgi:hypothetical protein